MSDKFQISLRTCEPVTDYPAVSKTPNQSWSQTFNLFIICVWISALKPCVASIPLESGKEHRLVAWKIALRAATLDTQAATMSTPEPITCFFCVFFLWITQCESYVKTYGLAFVQVLGNGNPFVDLNFGKPSLDNRKNTHKILNIRIYTLNDLCVSSNLIGSLSLAN